MILLYKIAAAIALAVALLAIGYSNGSSSGYKKGVASMQDTVNKVTNTINKEHADTNTKIVELEQQAATANSKANAAQKESMQAKTTIVTQYQTQYVKEAAECGLGVGAIAAINGLIDVDNKSFLTLNNNIDNTEESKPK